MFAFRSCLFLTHPRLPPLPLLAERPSPYRPWFPFRLLQPRVRNYRSFSLTTSLIWRPIDGVNVRVGPEGIMPRVARLL
ncbi:MAG: hypothetical protein RLZZ597_2811 [Cyanobacteriota bacterium]|jgi:hypothetical protein